MNVDVPLSNGGEIREPRRPDSTRLTEVDDLLSTVAMATTSTMPFEEFALLLLRSAMQAAQANGAALWNRDASNRWAVGRSIGRLPAIDESQVAMIDRIAVSGIPRLTGGLASEAGNGAASSDVMPSIAAAPMSQQVLALYLPSESVGEDGRLLIEIVRSFAEIGSDYFNRRELEALRMHADRSRRLEAFTRNVYRSLEVGPTAFTIANDGRTVIGCDRLSVAAAGGGRILAVSGVEFPDRRSDDVRRLEHIAAESQSSDGRYWRFRGDQIESDAGTATPPLTEVWRELLAVRPGMAADIVVLAGPSDADSPGRTVGVLIAEWFDEARQSTPDRVLPVAIHAEQALRNSLDAAPGPLAAVVRRLALPLHRRHRLKSAVVLAFLVVAGLLLTLVKADFVVPARGRLMPVESRDVFAPSDGVVASLEVRGGMEVDEQDVLLTLTDPLLDLEQERVLGELDTARQRLLAVQAERLTGGRPNATATTQPGRLAADERELSAQVESLGRQLGILERQQQGLSVRSPIRGTVLTWEADERLEDRPVRRGQRLLTVVDLDSDWRLELFVADRSTGHLLAARHAMAGDQTVDYLLATDPRSTYRAVVDRVALATDQDDDGRPSLRISARLPRGEIPAPRPGATVVANVHCGRRALGYVWFHEIYEAVLTHVLF